jgi:nucleotide-binding universal stress UspA family protein
LRWAARFAGEFGARIEAVIAWEYPVGLGWSPIPDGWNPQADMRTVLATTVREVFGEHPPPGLRLVVCEGSPARVLRDRSVGARLLVVGSRGHGGFAGLLLGSVSAGLAEHARCPVLIIHGDEAIDVTTARDVDATHEPSRPASSS